MYRMEPTTSRKRCELGGAAFLTSLAFLSSDEYNLQSQIQCDGGSRMSDAANSYQGALDYLYSFVDYSLTHNLRNAAEHFDLLRMEEFLRLLGSPQAAYPVIHIAGTKGKGSTSVFTAGALQAAGYRVGLYTSPHLQNFTERIQTDRVEILPEQLAALVEEIKPVVAQVPRLTTFEISTALAFLHFQRSAVDVAVFEVGLGGRLDATNVVEPLVSVITSLSMDHMAVLGDTIEKIAFEKGGIIKPGRPVVLAPQQSEAARAVIADLAQQRGCPLTEVAAQYRWTPAEHTLDWQQFVLEYRSTGKNLHLTIPLLGSHQLENAATAYAALQVANQHGLAVLDSAVIDGFARASWQGRFDLLQREPPLVVDSAHNRESALRLRQTIDEYFPNQPVILLFGASEDKDIDGILDELLPRAQQVITTRSVHPRAASAELLAELVDRRGAVVQAVPQVEEALSMALRLAQPGTLICGTGSIFIAAAIRDCWFQLQKHG